MAMLKSALIPRVLIFAAISTSLHQSAWQVEGVRVKLFPDSEPGTPEVNRNYRVLHAGADLYSLAAADSLEDAYIANLVKGYEVKPGDKLGANDFRFNSSDFLQKYLEFQYFVPYEERVALQVYDDARDRDLAAGPQVNQELCGQQLDYMHYLARHRRANVITASESSIFKILDTFDWPHYGLSKANNYYLGDYGGCMSVRLNVIKQELARVNKSAAEMYFATNLNVPPKERHSPLVQWIIDYLGPFVALPKAASSTTILRKNKDNLRAVPMRYCVAGIRWPSWSNSSHHRRNIVLRTAACLPETCDSKSIEVHGDKIKRLVDLQSNEFHSGYYISDLYCLPDEESSMRRPFNYSSTIIFVMFNAIWICLTVFVMVLELAGWSAGKYLDFWSLKKNWINFWGAGKKMKEEQGTPASQSPRKNLEPLEGLKIFAALLIISCHSFGSSMPATWNFMDSHRLLKETYAGSLYTVGPTSVDIFFVLTGVLAMNLLMTKNRSSLMKPSFWIGFIVYRYIRIIPLYALVHWFLQTGFRFLGSGPLWDYGTSHSAWSKICQNESLLDIFLPRANFKSPNNTCNPVGWYLANDILFALITPFIVVLYARKPRLAHLLVGSSIVALVANHMRYYLPIMPGARNVFQWDLMTFTGVFHDSTSGYVNPQYRVVSYLIGLATGYVLYNYGKGSNKWPRSFVVLAKLWLGLSVYLLTFLPFLSSLIPLDNEPLVKLLALAFLGTMHFTASVSAAIFILLACTGNLPTSMISLCSWPGFKPWANASLSLILVQVPLIVYHTQSLRILPELSHYYLLSTFAIWCLEIFTLACIVHVVYEVPMKRFLVKIMLIFLDNNKKSAAKAPPTNGMVMYDKIGSPSDDKVLSP